MACAGSFLPMIAAIWSLLLGIPAGWIVNVLADALPARRSLGETWRWPFQRLGLMRWQAATGHQPPATHHPPPTTRYLIVWAAAMALSWLVYAQFGWTPKAMFVALEAWFFLAIAVIDLEHRLVLNRMLLAAAPFALVANLLMDDITLISAVSGAAAGFGLLLLIALLARGGMGMGDVKLAGLIGLTTGLSGILVALYIGVLAGGIAGLVMLIKNRFQPGQTMAYAPYLVIGAWVVLLNGVAWLGK
jgi:prepilin signal peptidase PulO-like enzyme (type II secretory pathway)